MPNGTLEDSLNYSFFRKGILIWGSWDLTGRFPFPSRSQMLSPKIIYFDSMKDMNITDSLKASIFLFG